jgi:hypothetical protein
MGSDPNSVHILLLNGSLVQVAHDPELQFTLPGLSFPATMHFNVAQNNIVLTQRTSS